MKITASKAKKCVTHHYACDCREYKYEQMESALHIIRTWAKFDIRNAEYYVPTLTPKHVVKLCNKVLDCLENIGH